MVLVRFDVKDLRFPLFLRLSFRREFQTVNEIFYRLPAYLVRTAHLRACFSVTRLDGFPEDLCHRVFCQPLIRLKLQQFVQQVSCPAPVFPLVQGMRERHRSKACHQRPAVPADDPPSRLSFPGSSQFLVQRFQGVPDDLFSQLVQGFSDPGCQFAYPYFLRI